MTNRLFDLILGTIFFIFSVPIILFFAAIVFITSQGGAFFKQKRFGLNGKTFYIYKIRTMYINNDQSDTSPEDIRITPIGKFLRKTKIDELPQLWNVLKGEMSMVGPRPKRVFTWNYFCVDKNVQLHILSIKPGITGPSQVLKLRFNDEYLWINEKHIFTVVCAIESGYVLNKSTIADLRYCTVTIFLIVKQFFSLKPKEILYGDDCLND